MSLLFGGALGPYEGSSINMGYTDDSTSSVVAYQGVRINPNVGHMIGVRVEISSATSGYDTAGIWDPVADAWVVSTDISTLGNGDYWEVVADAELSSGADYYVGHGTGTVGSGSGSHTRGKKSATYNQTSSDFDITAGVYNFGNESLTSSYRYNVGDVIALLD